MEKQMKTRWLRLAFGAFVLLFAGIIYAWSLINEPFSKELGFDRTALSLNYTILMCFFCIGGLISGLLAKKISGTVRMIAAALLVCAGFSMVSFLNESIIPLYIGYGFMTGSGIGIVYNVVIANINSHFPDRKGIASGTLMMAFGFSTLILGNIAVKLFAVPSIGWRTTYIILGIVTGIIILAGAFIVTPAKYVPEIKAANKNHDAKDYNAKEMLKRPSFYKLFIFFILFAAVGSTAISGAKNQFAELGVLSAGLMAGVLTVCNGVGRIVSGAFFDAFGLRKTQYLTSIVVILATVLTLAGYKFGLTVIGAIGLCLCGFSYGFSPTVSAAFASAFYGGKNFSLNFAILNLILIPASFVPTLTSTLSYPAVFGILVIFSIAGLVINLSIKKA